MLPRERRLSESRAFSRVFGSGGRGAGDALLVVKSRSAEGEEIRAGVSVSRKRGPAHVRNRLKRRLRHAVAHLLPTIRPGTHLVIVAKAGSEQASYATLLDSLERLLRRAGRIN